jgi:RNA polymerase sigma-70 factor (ECF subfamily)
MLIIFSVISDDDKGIINLLLIHVGKGDKEALSEIYDMVGGRMLSVACGIVKNHTQAEDIVHDSFIKIIQYSSQFKRNDNGYGWICTIVRNTALNSIKKENLRQGVSIDTFYNISDNYNLEEDREKALLVESAMAVLNEKEKTAIWLRYFNDMTIRDIAKEMNLPRSTTSDLIKAAEEKMRKILC